MTSYSWSSKCDNFMQSNHGMQTANLVVKKVAAESGVLSVDMYSTGKGQTRKEFRAMQERNQNDECMHTHWPFYVITEQLNLLVAKCYGD